ncbi:MAG TPA: reverse transcriptase domain-containing protein [Opitutaceae bacterium]
MKANPNEPIPTEVPTGDKPGGKIHGRWPWVERTVWTERMLETLERGPKNGVWHSLIDKVYAPRTLQAAWVWIAKPGSREQRPLGIPAVRDRIVQTALRMVLEPVFERDFARESHGFRPGRGCPDALDRVEQLLAEGSIHIVDADLKSYFDTIPHEALLERVKAKVVDRRILGLAALVAGSTSP